LSLKKLKGKFVNVVAHLGDHGKNGLQAAKGSYVGEYTDAKIKSVEKYGVYLHLNDEKEIFVPWSAIIAIVR
jgi:predicted RNA-binding protein (virulence factor B family)